MTEREVLRIEFNGDERADFSAVAIEFSVYRGQVHVHEDWGSDDEAYSNGYTIRIPQRMWAEAAPWIATRLR